MNRATIVFCKFVNLDDNGNETDSSYGYRIYDDYDHDYNNAMFESFEEMKEHLAPDRVLAFLRMHHHDFYDWVEGHGLYINDKWYSPEDIGGTSDSDDDDLGGEDEE